MAEFVHGNVSTSTLCDLNKATLLMLMRCNGANPNTINVLSKIYMNKQDHTVSPIANNNDDDNDNDNDNKLCNWSHLSPPAHFT